MTKQQYEDYKEKFPFLIGLVLADNNFHYIDENGQRKPVDPQEIIKKIKERKKEVDKN